jgi:hypothetical protein
MPRVLPVSEVRNHLYWAAGGPEGAGAGEPTVALLGSLFHQLFGQLTGPDPRASLVGPLQMADATLPSWQQALTSHAYKSFVAPVLAAHQAALQTRSAEVLGFWTAVRSLCEWLAGVLFEQRGSREGLEAIRGRVFAAAEQEVSAELSDPSWTDTVMVQGRADAVLVQRGTARRCVVELKLGRSAPEADLLQACLYHLLLSAGRQRPVSRLALLTFEPTLREHLFEARQLAEAQARLKALVWRLAGGEEAASPVPPVPVPTPAGPVRPVQPVVTPPPSTVPHAAAPDQPPARPEAAVASQPAKSQPVVSPPAVAPPQPDSAMDTELAALGRKLEGAFAEFGAPIELEGVPTVGPAFIRFLAKPRRGVTVPALTRLGESVWMRLRTSEPPHVSLERGRVAIDVERADRETVELAAWRHELPAREGAGCSRFPVGVTVDGRLHFADLSRPESAHFLVAGTSGSGKSEWLRATVAALLAANSTATLRLALIDPKRSAFAAFPGSPYLWRPIVYSEGVEALLEDLVDEMERRYEALERAGVDHLAEYNARAEAVLPRIVCVCDEYADLLLADRRQREVVEGQVARLGAKARAAGVHLIFATQRPSRDVVKGVIDANFSGRVALKVVRAIESRIILDETGAETLLGRGDLLFRDVGSPVRLQGLLVSRGELEALAR